MTLAACKFKLNEEISLSGKLLQVTGLVQYEGDNSQIYTRYHLTEAVGAPEMIEENGADFALLRPFPATAQPQATPGTITVMNARYALSGVRKLKLLGAAGQPPGGVPKAEVLLSGLFEGEMGALLREMAPGAGPQTFYFLKRLHAKEVLSSVQRVQLLEAERLAADVKAQADEEVRALPVSGPMGKIIVWIVVILVVAGLGFACSGPDQRKENEERPGWFILAA